MINMINKLRRIVLLMSFVCAMPLFAGEASREEPCAHVKEKIKNGTFTLDVNRCKRKVLDAYMVYPQQVEDQSDYQKATALFTFLKNGTLQSTNKPLWIAGKPIFFRPKKEEGQRRGCPGEVQGCEHADTSFKLTEITDQMLEKEKKGQKLEMLDLVDWKVRASVPSSKRCGRFFKTDELINPCAGLIQREKRPLIKESQVDDLGWGVEEQHAVLATANPFYTQKFISRIQWFGPSANRFMIQTAKDKLEEPKLDKKRVSFAIGGAVAFVGALVGGFKLWSMYKNTK